MSSRDVIFFSVHAKGKIFKVITTIFGQKYFFPIIDCFHKLYARNTC